MHYIYVNRESALDKQMLLLLDAQKLSGLKSWTQLNPMGQKPKTKSSKIKSGGPSLKCLGLTIVVLLLP